ncbi:hypothetical protein K7432_010201 [Basidiobolus ranarum]|uniref:Uncharacterized protein n=1 Tax=Basidiobolus ranarum TaxID=34480 RepID=A0ABR2VWA4_9FUNG
MFLRTILQSGFTYNFRRIAGSRSVATVHRSYTNISSIKDPESTFDEREHHRHLVNILNSSSDDDWSIKSVQNHPISAPTPAPLDLSQDIVWNDLTQD